MAGKKEQLFGGCKKFVEIGGARLDVKKIQGYVQGVIVHNGEMKPAQWVRVDMGGGSNLSIKFSTDEERDAILAALDSACK